MHSCKICNKEYSDNVFKAGKLGRHIIAVHSMSIQAYYDFYYKKENEEICPICGKPNIFKGINKGYTKYCSVKCSKQDPKLITKQKQTCLQKYGVDHISKSKYYKDKIKTTNKNKYGVEYTFQAAEVKDKIKQSMLNKYGVDNCSKAIEIKQKKENTYLSKYGTKNNFGITSISEKAVKNAFSANAIAKRQRTCIDRYGVKSVLANQNIHSKNIEKAKQKIIETKRKNGTFNTSKPENDVYDNLITMFGINDIKRNYKSTAYPFLCDFYIVSLDLYIECNFSWTHGGHWYNNDDISIWKDKAAKSNYYKNAINTWTVRDINKRKIAKQNNLNYVVFWVYRDFLTWLSLNCPIGHDWIKEYSWLPNRILNNQIKINKLSEGSQLCTKLAKYVQFNEFYKSELQLWLDNPFEQYGTLQSNLYNNRLQYIGKNPKQLSNLEILRGLNISGKIRSYTTFDNSGMKQFLDKYKPTSVYDPCAGWGERLITCAYRNIKYFGIDINKNVVNNHQKLINMFGLTNQFTICADSASYELDSEYDTVFTCPPYWNTEIYTNIGAENLSYIEFLNWWKNTIKHSKSKMFVYQINQKYKTDMNRALLDLGYSFVEEIVLSQKSSHFTNYDGRCKKEYESIQVFKIRAI